MASPSLSIVATLYQSAQYVAEFCNRASNAASQIAGDDYEIVLVNDGSPDNSLALAIAAAQANPRISVVDLSRNFGHHRAMMSGVMHARGQRIFLIDSDLEEEPEWLLSFTRQMAADDCDVVYGILATRRGGWFERWSGALFYALLETLSALKLPRNVTVARLMTRRYVDALVQHDEREIYIGGLFHITGFDQRPQIVTKHSSSPTTYSLWRKIALLVNSVTSFSNVPLYGIFYFGLAISLVAAASLVYLMVAWLLMARPPEGWTSLIVSVWLLGGLTISFIGVIGIYLAKIFAETKRRPYVLVRRIYAARRSE
jgi:putative glycosyltransferase